MTKEEFEQQYAERSHVTVERLHELGRYAVPCDCGDESCQGWQMLHKKTEREMQIDSFFNSHEFPDCKFEIVITYP